MITRFVKTWQFTEKVRNKIQLLSNKARLNSENKTDVRLQLKSIGSDVNNNPIYSLDNDIVVKLWATQPNAMNKWLMFEPIYSTTESDFREYVLELSNKNVDWFDHSVNLVQPIVGDKVYQGDKVTTISEVALNKIRLADATFSNGRVFIRRSECEVLFRIYNDSNSYFYNTTLSSWTVAGSSDWNTEFVLSNHLPSLDISTFGKKIGIEIKLRTYNQLYTPLVLEARLLGRFDIEFAEDMIYDSVIAGMKNRLEVTTKLSLLTNTDTDVIDFASEYQLEKDDYNFLDGVSVYNLTTDPNKTNNLFSSYTVGLSRNDGSFKAGQVQLTAIQDADSELEITLSYMPVIAINTSMDYYEVNRVPSIVFEKVSKTNPRVGENSNLGSVSIRNKLNLTGVRHESPAINDLVFEYVVFTGNQLDQHRLGEALQRLFNGWHHVISWGLDEPCPIKVLDVFSSENTANTSDVNTHVGSFVVMNVLTQIREPSDVYLVDYLKSDYATI